MFVRKKKYVELRDRYEDLEKRHSETTDRAISALNDLSILEKKVKELEEKLKGFENTSPKVTLNIAEDATSVTPVVSYNESILDKLVEQGYINDAVSKDKWAVQLAMIQVAHEALEQIIESFSPSIEEV